MNLITPITRNVRQTANATKQVLRRLHRDERGAEGLEKLLIVAVIVLPLLGLLIVFRDRISGWAKGEWDAVVADGDDPINTDLDTPSTASDSGGSD